MIEARDQYLNPRVDLPRVRLMSIVFWRAVIEDFCCVSVLASPSIWLRGESQRNGRSVQGG